MINQLCKEIETALNHKIKTPKDFDFLRENIYARLHVLVSRTTLMRIWGYLSEDVTPRVGTLSILAKFLGYSDWEGYCKNSLDNLLINIEKTKKTRGYSARHLLLLLRISSQFIL